MTQVIDLPIRSVNIGGGSPDLLGPYIENILKEVTSFIGFSDQTELASEIALSTVRDEFLEKLIEYGVHKLSFGIQTFDPKLRKYLRLPANWERKFNHVLDVVRGRIPVINADLITCLPGQTLEMSNKDLRIIMSHSDINSISSYLLTSGAAPTLVSSVLEGKVPDQVPQREQAYMRLHTYASLLRSGWVRKGTNTYMDPSRISENTLDLMGGNECIGTGKYDDFLIGVGPQAISHLPGLRLENTVDIHAWINDVEEGRHSFYLPKCALVHQKDLALWTFPLRFKGLSNEDFRSMLKNKAISAKQLSIFNKMLEEGLIQQTSTGYELSIVGEVFMGHMVRDLKKPVFQKVIDDYIEEGNQLGKLISSGTIRDKSSANNRQLIQNKEVNSALALRA